MIIAKNERGIKDQIRIILDQWSNFSEKDNAARFNQYLGLRLRLRRIAMGLTQTKVAHMLNVTFQQIQKYEKGTNAIPLNRLIMFLEATDIDWDYFFRILHKLEKKIYINGGR